MNVDPHAWMLTIPLAVALIQFRFQPASNPLKRIWTRIMEMEEESWSRLAWIGGTAQLQSIRRWHKPMFCIAVIGLALTSIASFGSFLGLWPNF